MTKYNGWTNYATWRVNLEMIDGLDPKDMCWDKMDRFDLADALKEFCDEMLEQQISGKEGGMTLIYSYAQAFLSDVSWREIADHVIDAYPEHFSDPEPFKVLGIDNDGSPTVLAEFDHSSQAKDWARKYVSTENAGNWPVVCVDDTRDECAETIWKWEAEQQEA
jgi:hypothetical protein